MLEYSQHSIKIIELQALYIIYHYISILYKHFIAPVQLSPYYTVGFFQHSNYARRAAVFIFRGGVFCQKHCMSTKHPESMHMEKQKL